MKIFLSGVETNNKGAELMLYAILQETERIWPQAEIYIPVSCFKKGDNYIKTSLVIKPWPFDRLFRFLRIACKRLHLPIDHLQNTFAVVRGADFFLDASGFQFSDKKLNFTPARVRRWRILLRKYAEQGTKIIFLPQAFGPANKDNTLKGLGCLSEYANLIMARERVSYDYLEKSGVMDMKKVVLYKDFTSLVNGTVPVGYEHLRDGICIIPNMRMIDTGTCSFDDYIRLMSAVVKSAVNSGHLVYFLNHEGKDDEKLAYRCKEVIDSSIEVISGLNALEVKGLIASAYLVVSSRFHGVASSLNSCVPCLATSWSHKYQELYKDYGLENCILPLNNVELVSEMMSEFLDSENNANIKKKLAMKVPEIKEMTRQMWKMVWSK